MDAREQVLRAIGRQLPPAHALPDLNQSWITFADRGRQFQSVLETVGGACVRCRSSQDVAPTLQRLSCWESAAKRCCLIPGIGDSSVDLEAVADPRDLADVDVAIAAAEFGVAENGAVWVTNRGVRHRAIFFIAQHLVLVLAADQIVDNMHQAYERLRLGLPEFGVFISGPSKTADIEQSLVIGAHGARSLTILLVEPSSSGSHHQAAL